MKCEKCRYLYRPEYESSYTSCLVFGDETPEEYMRKDGEGCTCNGKQLAKMYENNLECQAKEDGAFVKWMRKQE